MPEYAEAIIRLISIWVYEGAPVGNVLETAENLNKYPPEYFFVAFDGETTVGFIKCQLKTDNTYCIFPIGCNYLEVSEVFVMAGYRHNGIGSELIRLVETRAKEDGIQNLSLYSVSNDSGAIRRFYHKNGYGIWTNHYYKRLDWQVRRYPLNTFRQYKFTVIFARNGTEWIYARHKNRDTYETAGGHIEPGETPLECAKRELYEETGAIKFSIHPAFDYSVHTETEFSYGQVFYADIETLEELPESEMAEVKGFHTIPDRMTYPQILPVIFKEMNQWLGLDKAQTE